MLRLAMLPVILILSGCLNGKSQDILPSVAHTARPTTESPDIRPESQPTCSIPKPAINSSAETHADYSKAMINAQPAYDMGLTGHCVEVAVVDSGLGSMPHAELPRESVDIVRDQAWSSLGFPVTYTDRAEIYNQGEVLLFSEANHGTEVSSLVAAAADGYGMHGVAPGSRVRMLTFTFGDSGGTPLDFGILKPGDGIRLARTFAVAMQYGSILNMSWGWLGTPSHPEPNPTAYPAGARSHYTEADLRAAFGTPSAETLSSLGFPPGSDPGDYDFIALAAQADVDEDDRKIFVWAAGNAGESEFPFNPLSPDLPAGLQGRIAELRGHWLSVVAIDATGEIADFSNRCGVTKDYCIAAPGVCVLAATAYPVPAVRLPPVSPYIRDGCIRYDPGLPNYFKSDGTSYSAPMVSGALALMMERFRGQLGNTAVIRRMLDTADKTGIYADSDIYGQGLLDVGAAVLPVGQQQLSLQGHAVPLPGFNTAFTDPFQFISLLQNGISEQQVMVLDELGGPFWLAFSELPGAALKPQNPIWRASATLVSHQSASGIQEILQSGIFTGTKAMAGYALDTGFQGQWGFFISTGLAPAALTGLRRTGLKPEDFGRDTAFTAPWLSLLAQDSIGAGARLQTASATWTFSGFRGRASSGISGGADNSLIMLEYQRSSQRLDLLLQRGSIEEPDSWGGAWTEHSIYGHFAGRMQFAGLTTAWRMAPDWQLLGALQWMQMHLKPLSQGLLLEFKELQDHRLELGVLGRSVLHRDDTLGLRWQAGQSSTGRAVWRLPQRLYRRRVQYSDLTLELQGPVHQSLELSWRMPLQRESGLLIGWGRSGPDSALYSENTFDYITLQLDLSF